MVCMQGGYTVYLVLFIRYTKIRFDCFIMISNFLTTGMLLASFLGAQAEINSATWKHCKLAY